MIEPLPAETLAWLHRVADAGYAQPMVLRHVMQRLDALESDRAQELRASHAYNEAVVEETVRRLQNLEIAHQQLQQQQFLAHLNTPLTEADRKDLGLPSAELDDNDEAAHQQPADHVPGATEMVPTPETAPAARPEGDWFAVAMVAQDMRSRGLAEQIAGDELLKLANRQCSAARASGLLERVAAEMSGDDDPSIDARAAIREVAAWLDLEGYVRAANNLRKEVAE